MSSWTPAIAAVTATAERSTRVSWTSLMMATVSARVPTTADWAMPATVPTPIRWALFHLLATVTDWAMPVPVPTPTRWALIHLPEAVADWAMPVSVPTPIRWALLHLLAAMPVTGWIRCILQQTVMWLPVPTPIRWALTSLLRWGLWTSPVDHVVEVPTPKWWAPASPGEQ